jgi:hypothetical protein
MTEVPCTGPWGRCHLLVLAALHPAGRPHVAHAAPRAPHALPLLLIELAMVAAVLALLAPVLFVRSREPFERLVVILALVLRR